MAGLPHRAVGLRRVAWVRVSLGGRPPVAEAFGISHRVPRVHRVSLATATELVRGGVPLVVRRAPRRAGAERPEAASREAAV